MVTGLFGGNFARLESMITARENTQQVFSGNIANADTPNYKPDQRTFADFLAVSQRAQQPVSMRITNSHMMDTSSNSRPLVDMGGVFSKHHTGEQRMDGNAVDLQQEMVDMAKNQMLHDLSVKLIKGNLMGLQRAIREGR
ncbi:MAG: flagellar basal body rod protein FlgB [Mariprofundales bacterium]|nr:flagellar basal body rod protein FlgB [Mariprofundales bacterium]